MIALAPSSGVSFPGNFDVPQIAGRLCSDIPQFTVATLPPDVADLGNLRG